MINGSLKINKLIKGILNIGKYPGYLAIAASLGCIHGPNPISVSSDGRYVSAIVYQSDNKDSLEKGKVVLIDTETGEIKPIKQVSSSNDFIFNSITKDRVAIMRDIGEKNGLVQIISDTEELTINRAGFPKLIAGTDWIAYSKLKEKPSKEELGIESITLRNLKNNYERGLGIEGIVTDVSPDLKYLAFLTLSPSKENDRKDNITIEICDMYGKNRRKISEMNLDGISLPYWMDNNRLLFQTTPYNEKDSEIFIASKNGGTTQITNNHEEEVFPHTSGGRIYFLSKKEKEDEGTICYLNEEKGVWKTYSTGIKVGHIFRITDNKLFYYKDDCLFMQEINNPQKRVNINSEIYPSSKDPSIK